MDQSYSLNCYFIGCIVISDLYLFQDIVLCNPYFKCSKNLVLLFIDKVTMGTQSLALFIWNVAQVVNVASAGLSPVTATALDISEFTQFFDHDKLRSISKLIKRNSKDLQKLLRYFNGTTTSASNLIPIIIWLD